MEGNWYIRGPAEVETCGRGNVRRGDLELEPFGNALEAEVDYGRPLAPMP